MKTRTMSLLFLVLTLLLIFLCYFLFIGEPVDGAQMTYTVASSGGEIIVSIETSEPDMALRGWKLRQEDGILYITARKVPLAPFYSTEAHQVSFDPGVLTQVYLGGRPIWVAD